MDQPAHFNLHFLGSLGLHPSQGYTLSTHPEATNVKLTAAIQPGRLRIKKGARISLGISLCRLPPREAKATRNSEHVAYLCTRNS